MLSISPVIWYSSVKSLWQRSKNSEFVPLWIAPKTCAISAKRKSPRKKTLKFRMDMARIEMSGLFQRFSTQGNFCSSPNVSHSPEIHGKNFKYQNNRFASKQPVGSHKDGFLGNAHGSWVANWASSDGKNNFRRKREDFGEEKNFTLKDIFWVAGLGQSTFPDPFVTWAASQSSAPNMCLPLASPPPGTFT